MFKVLYIDEEVKMHRRYKRYAEGCFEIETVSPHDSLEELINYISEISPNAIIVDHNLAEFKATVNYDGVDVVREYRKVKASFPIFILTSFDDRAIAEAEDVNIVYSKSEVNISERDNKKNVTFNDKVLAQIEHYLKRIDMAEKEALALIERASEEPLDIHEEARLIELDSLLNGELDKAIDIPPHLKNQSNIELTKQLIEVSEGLINAISDK